MSTHGIFLLNDIKKKNNNNFFGPRQKFTCATAQKNMLCTIVCYFIIRGLTIQSNARGLIYNVSINKKQQAFDSSSLNTRRLNKFYNPVNNDLRKRWSQRHCNNTCNKTCCQSHVKNVVQIIINVNILRLSHDSLYVYFFFLILFQKANRI